MDTDGRGFRACENLVRIRVYLCSSVVENGSEINHEWTPMDTKLDGAGPIIRVNWCPFVVHDFEFTR